MTRAREEAIARQHEAANPDVSAWVMANAGSGKTTVLTERVARMLLSGADPARILCITYTKAAAAEMERRLFKMLGRWSTLDDERRICKRCRLPMRGGCLRARLKRQVA